MVDTNIVLIFVETNKQKVKIMEAIIWKDNTITYQEGNSTYTDKIVETHEDYYIVVGIGAGEELWNAGCAVGRRVYKEPIDLSKL